MSSHTLEVELEARRDREHPVYPSDQVVGLELSVLVVHSLQAPKPRKQKD